MIAKIARNAGTERKNDRDGGRFQTHVFFSERTKENSNNSTRRKSSSFGFLAVKSFCDENPTLRPSLCSGIIFITIGAGALVALYFYRDTLFIPCLSIAAASFASAVASLICCCIRRRSLRNQPRTAATVDDKEGEKLDFLNIEDPLLHKAITHFHYRCCEEAWQPPLFQQNSFQTTRKVLPIHKSHYEFVPASYRRNFQSGYYPS